MYTIFPPPPKPPKKNYIKENIKQLQALQTYNKQEVRKNNLPKQKLTNGANRPIPRSKTEPTLKTCTTEANHHDVFSKQQTRDQPKTTTTKLTSNFNFKSIIKPTNNMLVLKSQLVTPRTPKLRDAGCQYLESDSRYYFADGSTVHFVYPSENRKSILSKQSSTAWKTSRANSVYNRTTESYRRKHLGKVLSKNHSDMYIGKTVKPCKDADCQYSELDFYEVPLMLPEESLNSAKESEPSSRIDIEVPKLNLKDSVADLVDGVESMASIIEGKRSTKPPESERSSSRSALSLHLDDKQSQITEASVVPLVDLELNGETKKEPDTPLNNEDIVKKLRSKFSRRVNELNHMPMRSDTLRAKTRKIQLEKELMELEKNIKLLSHHHQRRTPNIRATS